MGAVAPYPSLGVVLLWRRKANGFDGALALTFKYCCIAQLCVDQIPETPQFQAMQVPPPLFEAIALKKCVNAVYNKTDMTLVPLILYTRHGEVHLDAIPVKKRGEPPRFVKLATFKLAGLSDIEVTEDMFFTDPVYDPAAEKYAGVTVFAVEL